MVSAGPAGGESGRSPSPHELLEQLRTGPVLGRRPLDPQHIRPSRGPSLNPAKPRPPHSGQARTAGGLRGSCLPREGHASLFPDVSERRPACWLPTVSCAGPGPSRAELEAQSWRRCPSGKKPPAARDQDPGSRAGRGGRARLSVSEDTQRGWGRHHAGGTESSGALSHRHRQSGLGATERWAS